MPDDDAVGRSPGDRWIECACGDRHWGLFGAAGLLLVRDLVGAAGSVIGQEVLLQHRSPWSHRGDTWGIPGGARDVGEDALTAALREATEEAAIDANLVEPVGEFVLDHGTWSYTTIVARALGPMDTRVADPESLAIEWIPVGAVEELVLLPAFATAWPGLRAMVDWGGNVPPQSVFSAEN